jgi:hypothetical protein
LPDYYFRVRENGAVVFRVDTENRQRRIDMEDRAVGATGLAQFGAAAHMGDGDDD